MSILIRLTPCEPKPRRGTIFGSGATRRFRLCEPNCWPNGSNSSPGPTSFHAIGVEAEGRLLAALPLVRRKVARVLDAAAMPCNEWSSSGDLLLDAAADGDATLDVLAAAIGELPWPLLWLDEAVLDAPRWQRLQQALVRAGMTVATHGRWQVGRVEVDGHDWPAYKGRWSRKHRQQMAQALRRLADRGEVRLSVGSQLAPDEVAAWMQRGFEVEDRSWKGGGGQFRAPQPGHGRVLHPPGPTGGPMGPTRTGHAPLRRSARGLLATG